MPELKCTVQNCTHNQNYYCNLDTIQVGGGQAKTASDTCCDSFEERKSGTYTNSTMEASPLSTINCQAQECCYNDQCKCNAGKISVEGSGACNCKDTECATFRCR